eukprot:m51a1_g5047 hypothetical protein (642) ;mRNA; r:48583-53773
MHGSAEVHLAGITVGTVFVQFWIFKHFDDDDARADAARVARAISLIRDVYAKSLRNIAVSAMTAAVVESLKRNASDTAALEVWMSKHRAEGQNDRTLNPSAAVPYVDMLAGKIVTSRGQPPLFVGMVPVVASATSNVTVGYILVSRAVSQFNETLVAATSRACVSLVAPADIAGVADVREVAGRVQPAELPDLAVWKGKTELRTLRESQLAEYSQRTCMHGRESYATASVAYFALETVPEIAGEIPIFRVDVAQKDMYRGGSIAIIVAVVLFAATVVVCAIIFALLEAFVLRRIARMRAALCSALPSPAGIEKLLAAGGLAAAAGATTSSADTDLDEGDEIGELDNRVHRRLERLRERLEWSMRALLEQRHRRRTSSLVTAGLVHCCRLTRDGTVPGFPCASTGPSGGNSASLGLGDDVARLVESPVAAECLKSFAAENSSLENVQFLVDVGHVADLHCLSRASAEPERAQYLLLASQAAVSIAREYVEEARLNLSSQARQAVLAGSPTDPLLFAAAAAEITHLVRCDTMPRFLASPAAAGLAALQRMGDPGDALGGSRRALELVAQRCAEGASPRGAQRAGTPSSAPSRSATPTTPREPAPAWTPVATPGRDGTAAYSPVPVPRNESPDDSPSERAKWSS